MNEKLIMYGVRTMKMKDINNILFRMDSLLTRKRIAGYCIIAIVVSLLALLVFSTLGICNISDLNRSDFLAFYTGGKIVAGGNLDKLYIPDFQGSLQYSEGIKEDQIALFLNPPAYALLMVPLAALPYDLALTLCYLGIFKAPLYLQGIQSLLPKMQSFPAFVRLLWGENVSPFTVSLFAAAVVAAVTLLRSGSFGTTLPGNI